MKLTILRAICVLVIVAAVGLYVYGIAVQGDTPTENLLRSVIIALSGMSALMKLTPKRRPAKAYADAYAKELGSAFQEDPAKRAQLLQAIRLFDEDKYPAAMKLLDQLRPAATTRDAQYAVGLFTALCQTDLGLNEAAIATYEELAGKGITSSQLYSNLSTRYLALRQLDKAADACGKAVQLDPNNARAHNNLGNILMNLGEYAQANQCAQRACALEPTLQQAWTLRAISSAVLGDTDDAEEAFRRAVQHGQEADALQAAMDHYVALAKQNAEG